MVKQGQELRAERGGPARVWATILLRSSLKAKQDTSWRLIPMEDGFEDIEDFHAVYIDRSLPQSVVRDAYPDHWTALHWFLGEFQTSLRWPLEAWLMTGQGSLEIAKKIDPSWPSLAVDIYRRAFFSLSEEQIQTPGWMFRYIWGPGMAHKSSRYYYDFFLKAVSFYKGPEMLEKVLSGDALEGEAVEVLRSLAMGLRDRLVLTDINVRNTLSNSERAPLVENAVAQWKAEAPPAFQSNPLLDQLSEVIKAKVSVLPPGVALQDTYEFTSEKYEDPQCEE